MNDGKFALLFASIAGLFWVATVYYTDTGWISLGAWIFTVLAAIYTLVWIAND